MIAINCKTIAKDLVRLQSILDKNDGYFVEIDLGDRHTLVLKKDRSDIDDLLGLANEDKKNPIGFNS